MSATTSQKTGGGSANDGANGSAAGGASSSGSSDRPADTGDNSQNPPDGTFECNICLDTAHDAVVSMCGHLFWLVRPEDPICRHV